MAGNKKLLFLLNTKQSLEYTASGSGGGKGNFPKRDNQYQHADLLRHMIHECVEESAHQTSELTQEQIAAIHCKDGMYLEFSGAQNCDLAFKSLENLPKGIRLLNVKNVTEEIKATVYVPKGAESFFLNKIDKYTESIGVKKTPENNDLVCSIENIRLAVLESLWVGDNDLPSDTVPTWCEVWLRYGKKFPLDNVLKTFNEQCEALNIIKRGEKIVFPERTVVLISADRRQLIDLIKICAYVAEIRRAPELPTFFEDLPMNEQREWCHDLLNRTSFSESDSTVCILDMGVNPSHPLINPYLPENYCHTVNSAWGTIGRYGYGHGTELAGIALYCNLVEALSSNENILISHKLESVKILPDNGENDPQLYGAITEQAILLAEIANPTAKRAICMAVTSDSNNTIDGSGSPTSWSAAIDSIVYGDDEHKRLFFISAGNVALDELHSSGFPDANSLHNVENPGQSWNAVTVGGYNNSIEIQDSTFKGFHSVSDMNDLSPFSSTSATWDKKWPVKPEILLNAGGAATNGDDYTDCPDLSLLTTNHDIRRQLFTTVTGTSPATAEASWMAAQLFKEYPDIWPETVRALLIHSANWTDRMQRRFNTDDKKTSGRRNLLRFCGYGIPSLEKAMWCKNNYVSMVVEDALQPFQKDGGTDKMNEMNLHELPWPSETLELLGDTKVRLRVTLSYYIEPGPGDIGWKDKYRYPSCGLRFDLINNNENIDDFKKRVNVKMRGEDRKDSGEGSSGSGRWYLGSNNRDVGSIHSDFIDASAVELCNAKYIAVYPVVGWWKTRSYLGKIDKKIRYSLVVSLDTPKVEADLYTPIVTKIETTIPIT